MSKYTEPRDPPHLLVESYEPPSSEPVRAQGSSRLAWELNAVGDCTCLLLTHGGLRAGGSREVGSGWPQVLRAEDAAGDRRGAGELRITAPRTGREAPDASPEPG